MKYTALIGLICLFATAPALADMTTVNIDFQYANDPTSLYTGIGMAADSGTYWNEVATGSYSNLKASDGVTDTGIGVSTTYARPYRNNWPNNLLRDRLIWSAGRPGSSTIPAINISGLDVGTPYDIYLYAGYYAQTYTINGVPKSLTGAGYTLDQPSWTESVQYVYFPGVIAEDGAINIEIYNTAQADGQTDTVVSGMQIQQVPVPGAVLLGIFGLSVAGVKLRRRSV
jgi:hypothetical protein